MDDNPYRAPDALIGQEGEDFADALSASPSPERDLRVFVRRNADYYLKKWAPALRFGGGAGFNWAAFLFSGLWLPYRKMYKITFIFYGFVLLEVAAELAIAGLVPGSEKGVELVGRLVSLVATIIIGKSGNAWYLSHAQKAIAGVRSLGLPAGESTKELARRGGTNLPAAFGLMLLLGALLIAEAVVPELLVGNE
jgi:hypothetical protein